ncbi:MAG: glycosyltransferase [bacterium]|nr:glycosyltransferase [bacterium]
MKILQLHCRYQKGLGGEDAVVDHERNLLESRGHEVRLLLGENASIEASHIWGKFTGCVEGIWSRRSYRAALHAIEEFRPDVIHVHNTFVALSPSVMWAARRCGVPLVMTLHNYRLVCAATVLTRGGATCQLCIGRLPWPALLHQCRFKNSRLIGLAIVLNQLVHRALGTWRRTVDATIVLSEFARSIMIRSGLPAERVYVKPNFTEPHEALRAPESQRMNRFVFIGGLDRNKGVDLLIEAWILASPPGWSLILIGEGPEGEWLRDATRERGDIEWRGRLDHDDALREASSSRFLVLPSRSYEGCPMTVLEAFSLGVPVIVPHHGPFPDLVDEGRNALPFTPNDAASLAETLKRATRMNADERRLMSEAALEAYQDRFAEEANYQQLMAIYQAAIQRARPDGL